MFSVIMCEKGSTINCATSSVECSRTTVWCPLPKVDPEIIPHGSFKARHAAEKFVHDRNTKVKTSESKYLSSCIICSKPVNSKFNVDSEIFLHTMKSRGRSNYLGTLGKFKKQKFPFEERYGTY